jgi:hypothetical protein
MASEPRSAWTGAIRLAVLAIIFILGCPAGPRGAEDEDAGDSVAVRVYPYVSPQPATVQLRIQLTPHQANRRLIVEVDSLSLFRSSLIPLDGKFAPSVHWLTLEALSAGEYVVKAVLYRTEELPVATAVDSFMVR